MLIYRYQICLLCGQLCEEFLSKCMVIKKSAQQTVYSEKLIAQYYFFLLFRQLMAKEDFGKLGYHEDSGSKNDVSHVGNVKSTEHSTS